MQPANESQEEKKVKGEMTFPPFAVSPVLQNSTYYLQYLT